ncbi:MAG TPA: thioredoxin family protein [Gaiellaceae bacterium]|jgi:thioredoxin-like negative regulator of GroEL
MPPDERPLLLFFHSPLSGRCRLAEGYLAQTLQRNRNHDTFTVRRIDVTKRPDLAGRFRVDGLPVICVVEANRVVARIDGPTRATPIARALAPWLRRTSRAAPPPRR